MGGGSIACLLDRIPEWEGGRCLTSYCMLEHTTSFHNRVLQQNNLIFLATRIVKLSF